MNIINYLFNKGFLPFNLRYKRTPFMSNKAKKQVYNDPKYEEFREALLDDICVEMAECMELLSQPTRGDLELKGELNGINKVYARMIDLFAPQAEIKKHDYIDPFKRIEEEARQALVNRGK